MLQLSHFAEINKVGHSVHTQAIMYVNEVYEPKFQVMKTVHT